jgi:lipid-A-disaccharide synthase-like uncharacterized protein
MDEKAAPWLQNKGKEITMPQWIPEEWSQQLLRLTILDVIGFVGMVTFSSRFIVQWIVSEKKKESVIPVTFWYLSVIGSTVMLGYGIGRADKVLILMYLFNNLIYLRNLYFIYRKKNREAAA